jgi:dTDP-glucose 4,6-dehydratase
MKKNLIVTGGAGFIGSWFVKKALNLGYKIFVIDKLTYSGNLSNLDEVKNNQDFEFIHKDICDLAAVKKLINESDPDGIFHFAAESHVDNSISGPSPFIQTNLVGTYNLLESAREYYFKINREKARDFKFIHVSTDEVYGSLTKDEKPFSRSTSYAPNSPYSATKAGSDHLARAWHETYGLPVIITNCSNNYGPNQHPEKLIPKTIVHALEGKDIPIYGKGENIRDWIYVEDHVDGVLLSYEKGHAGYKYLFGGDNEIRNIDLVHKTCEILHEKTGKEYKNQIKFVVDRLGHDYRYAINSNDSKKELGFSNKFDFDTALRKTIDWYIEKYKN